MNQRSREYVLVRPYGTKGDLEVSVKMYDELLEYLGRVLKHVRWLNVVDEIDRIERSTYFKFDLGEESAILVRTY